MNTDSFIVYIKTDDIYKAILEDAEARFDISNNELGKRKNTGLKLSNDFKAFIEYSSDMDDIYKNIEEYNPNKKFKMLILFDNMIADMFSNTKLNPVVIELFIR